MAPAASEIYHPVSLDRERIALKAYDRYARDHPESSRDTSAAQKTRMVEDFSRHLLFLQEALAVNDAALFNDYITWAKILQPSRHLPENFLAGGLEVLKDVLMDELPPEMSVKAGDYLVKSITSLATAPSDVPSFISPEDPLGSVAQRFLAALLAADRLAPMKIIDEQVRNGVSARDIYLSVIQPALQEVGRLWQMQRISIATEHYITGTVQQVLARLDLPHLAKTTKRRGKTLVAACVSGEQHEVGIRMVTDFFEMDGWDTYYLGANTPAPDLIAAVKEHKADAVALSATMSWHLPRLDYLIRSLRGDPATRQVKIIVGGYPFAIVPDLWQRIGADANAGSAEEAVRAGNRLTSGI
jgi:MerR family transcriptional regulator, light-induced transcriptional regulator